MYAIRSYYALRLDGLADQGRRDVDGTLRITSYNVCYTKLLRFSPQGTAIVCELLLRGPQTPGVMNAAVADNVATITFDVVVNPDVPDGTVISNQAFV